MFLLRHYGEGYIFLTIAILPFLIRHIWLIIYRAVEDVVVILL
jgi:hypothetical protein